MPILSLEPFVFPERLFEVQGVQEDDSRSWWVLQTRPRGEKALARHLFVWEIPYFLPLYEKRARARDRIQKSHLPLFPGYVFLKATEEERGKALTTNLVANTLRVVGQARFHAELTQVHRLVNVGAPLTPVERLAAGTPVEIIRGPFAGLRGKVLGYASKLNIVVEVHFLNAGVSTEIEPWMVHPVCASEAAG
jgi:transcription antitermination factor NusG